MSSPPAGCRLVGRAEVKGTFLGAVVTRVLMLRRRRLRALHLLFSRPPNSFFCRQALKAPCSRLVPGGRESGNIPEARTDPGSQRCEVLGTVRTRFDTMASTARAG